jgi:tripeptide aminopeptidase
MSESSEPVRLAKSAAESIGLTPKLRIADGGLDANFLNAKGVPTVTLGAGQHNIHTVDEYVDLEEFVTGCQLLVAIATG